MLLAGLPVLAVLVASPQSYTSQESLAQHQRTAQEAEARGDFGAAVHAYRAMVRSLPNNPELESNLGVALYFDHELEEAESVFRQAIALKPDLYAPHLFLGLALFRLSEPDRAVVELEKAVALNDGDALAHTWLGYAYIAQSKQYLAIEQLKVAARLQPENVDVFYALGQCYLELGKQATRKLVDTSPDGGRTWQLAAEQAEAQANASKAASLYEGALQRRPDITSLRAKILELKGSVPEKDDAAELVTNAKRNASEDVLYEDVLSKEESAKAAFERVAQIDSNCYRAHQILADSDVAADRLDDAIVEYRKVLEQKPDLPGVHQAICNALSRTAQIQEAIRECEAEITVAPYSADAYVQAARVHLLVGEDARAETLLHKAVAFDRPPIAAYKFLGQVLLDEKQYAMAAKDLAKYLAVETKDSSGFYLLSRAYKSTGETQKMQEAISEYRKITASAKAKSEAQRTLDQKMLDEKAEDPGTQDQKALDAQVHSTGETKEP